MGEVMRRAHNRGAALNSEKNTYFLACDVDSNNYSFLNSTSIVTRRSIFVFRRRRVRAHTVNHQTRKLVLLRCVSPRVVASYPIEIFEWGREQLLWRIVTFPKLHARQIISTSARARPNQSCLHANYNNNKNDLRLVRTSARDRAIRSVHSRRRLPRRCYFESSH